MDNLASVAHGLCFLFISRSIAIISGCFCALKSIVWNRYFMWHRQPLSIKKCMEGLNVVIYVCILYIQYLYGLLFSKETNYNTIQPWTSSIVDFLCIALLHVTVDALSWCHKIIGTRVPIFMIIIWEPLHSKTYPKPTQTLYHHPPASPFTLPHLISHMHLFSWKTSDQSPWFHHAIGDLGPKIGGSPFYLSHHVIIANQLGACHGPLFCHSMDSIGHAHKPGSELHVWHSWLHVANCMLVAERHGDIGTRIWKTEI